MPEVESFVGQFCAIYRPRKNAYCILRYFQNGHSWKPYTERIPLDQLSLRITNTPNVIAKLYLHRRVSGYQTPNDANNLYNFLAYGNYIHWANPTNGSIPIPVLTLARGQRTIPAKFTKVDYSIPGPTTEHQVDLWQVRAAVAPKPEVRKTNPMPKHIVQLIAENAVSRAEQCPITMDDLTLENASVTSCYHVFNHDAINKWFEKDTTCPVCKTECTTIKAV
jgi:hypothetical protein